MDGIDKTAFLAFAFAQAGQQGDEGGDVRQPAAALRTRPPGRNGFESEHARQTGLRGDSPKQQRYAPAAIPATLAKARFHRPVRKTPSFGCLTFKSP
jgi:hypothetical protein